MFSRLIIAVRLSRQTLVYGMNNNNNKLSVFINFALAVLSKVFFWNFLFFGDHSRRVKLVKFNEVLKLRALKA